MTTLAEAWVQIIPSLKGAQRQIQSQLAGIDLTPAGSVLGEQLSGSIGKSMDLKTIGARFKDIGGRIEGVGRKLTNSITKPALIAGGAVGGLVAGLGFKRLVGLDRAEAQFKGLGYEVEKVMAQVDKGVTNTALSMADGAALAVGALATGNLPLKDLEAQIKRVANVSAAYGVEAEHAGYLLNNVLVKNKVTWGDLAQMQQNQIPIVSMLADHYGVAGDEIMKMAQDGKISIEDLNRVLDENAGAAAEEYAKSWDGIRANIVANIGRIGAAFLEGVFPQAKEEMADFLERLRSPEWTEKARELGEKVSEGFELVRAKIRELIDAWNALDDETQDWIKKAAVAAVAAGPFLIVVGKLVTGVGGLATGLGTVVGWLGSSGLGGALVRIAGPIGIAVALFKAMWENSDDLKDAVARLWDTLKEAWETVWPALKPVLEELGKLFEAVIPILAALAVEFIEKLLPKIEEFADEAIPVLEKVAKAIGWMVDALDTDKWEKEWGKAGGIASHWGGEITDTSRLVTYAITGRYDKMFAEIQSQFETKLPEWEERWRRWGSNVNETVERVRAWWSEKWEQISKAARTKFEEIRAGAEEKFNELVAFVRSIPDRIRAIFSNPLGWLKQAGRDVLEGFRQGLEEKFRDIRATLGNLTSMLPSWKGPPSTDKVILKDAGRMVMGGFVDGLESQYQHVRRSLQGFTGSLAGAGAGASALGGGSRMATVDDLVMIADRIEHRMEVRASVEGVRAFSGAVGHSDMAIAGQAVVRR